MSSIQFMNKVKTDILDNKERTGPIQEISFDSDHSFSNDMRPSYQSISLNEETKDQAPIRDTHLNLPFEDTNEM